MSKTTGIGLMAVGVILFILGTGAVYPLSTTCIPEYGVFAPSGALQGTGVDYNALYSQFISSGNYPGYYIQQIGTACYSSGTTTTTSQVVPVTSGPFYITYQSGTTATTGPASFSTASTIEGSSNPTLLLPTGIVQTAYPSTYTIAKVTDAYNNPLRFSVLAPTSDPNVWVALTDYYYLPIATLTATITQSTTQVVSYTTTINGQVTTVTTTITALGQPTVTTTTVNGQVVTTTVYGTSTTTLTATLASTSTITYTMTSTINGQAVTTTRTVTVQVPIGANRFSFSQVGFTLMIIGLFTLGAGAVIYVGGRRR